MRKKRQGVTEKLTFEREMLALGAKYIVGVDEVGRGPLAGPVVCAAVILPLEEENLIEGIDDSKKVSEKERERLALLIKERAIAYSICEVGHEKIDEINILEATKLCMRQAVESLSVQPDVVFIDGNFKIKTDLPQQSIVKGDSLSYSIGAASILAKVHRDALMREWDKAYPQYGFSRNKGYGTQEHIEGLREYGPCKIHRQTFIKKLLGETENDGRRNF